MLVDDNQLKQYTYDHTYGNVVYSGKLRNLTHVKILSLLLDLVKCFINCTSVKAEILETKAPNMESYHKNDYILSVTTTDKPQRQSPHRAFSGTKKIFSVVYSSLFSSKPSPTSTRIRRFRPDQSDPQRPCVSEFGWLWPGLHPAAVPHRCARMAIGANEIQEPIRDQRLAPAKQRFRRKAQK